MFYQRFQLISFIILIFLFNVKEIWVSALNRDGHEQLESSTGYFRRRSPKNSERDDGNGFQEMNRDGERNHRHLNSDTLSDIDEEDLLLDIYFKDDDIVQESSINSGPYSAIEGNLADEYDYYYYYYYVDPMIRENTEEAGGDAHNDQELLETRHFVDGGSNTNNGNQVLCFARANPLARKKGPKQSKSPGSSKTNKNAKAPKAPKSYYPNTPRPTSSEVVTCIPTINPPPGPNPNPFNPTRSPTPFCDPNVNLDCPRGTPTPREPTNPSKSRSLPPSPSFPAGNFGNPPSFPAGNFGNPPAPAPSPSSPSNGITPSPTNGGNKGPSPNSNPNPSPNVNPNPNQPIANPSDGCFALECPRATRPTS